MPPPLATNDQARADGVDTIAATKLGAGDPALVVKAAHFDHLPRRQLGRSAALSAPTNAHRKDGRGVAPLPNHVLRIVFGSAEEQVVRSDARRIITMMADLHPGRDGAARQFVSNPMGHRHLAGTNLDVAVAVLVLRPCPQPTGVGLFDFRPEPISQRRDRCTRLTCAAKRTKLGLLGACQRGTTMSAKSKVRTSDGDVITSAATKLATFGYVAKVDFEPFVADGASQKGGILARHRESHPSGVVPRAVSAAPGLFRACIIPKKGSKWIE
jgi:hypothetical protein